MIQLINFRKMSTTIARLIPIDSTVHKVCAFVVQPLIHEAKIVKKPIRFDSVEPLYILFFVE